MKRRRKARVNREVRRALRTSRREVGDHRRWWWMATMPLIIKDDPVFRCDTEVFFDPKWGRCYRPESLSAWAEK